MSLFVLLITSTAITSCSKDNDEPSPVVGKVTITNNSSYTLSSFVVVFVNDHQETITTENKGTFKPSEKIQVDIPIGATEYYMSTVAGGERFFSVNYNVSVKTQVLTDQIVGNWSN